MDVAVAVVSKKEPGTALKVVLGAKDVSALLVSAFGKSLVTHCGASRLRCCPLHT